MKYIVKRILIGVGIALAMMFITKTFSLSVHAESPTNILTLDKFRMTFLENNTVKTNEYTTVNNFTLSSYPSVPLYGKSSTGSNIQIRQIRYHFSTTGMKSGYYDINFLHYFGGLNSSYLNGINYSAYQEYGWYNCDIQTRLNVVPGQSGLVSGYEPYIQSVSCRNVYIDNSNPNLYILLHMTSQSNDGTGYGITTVNALYNSNNNQQEIVNNQETIIEQQQEQTEQQQKTNDLLEDDDSSDAQSSASDFFGNFSSTDHGGLSGVITSPLRFINALLNSGTMSGRCQPITVPLPFVNNNVILPCAEDVLFQLPNGGSLVSIILTITTGIIAYWVCVKIFAFIRSFKDPDKDKVEVLDL